MKSLLPIIVFFFLFLGTAPVMEAQYNGAMGRRRIVPQSQEPQKKPEPMTADEIVAAEMPKITEALSLNDFEQAILKSILTKYVQQRVEVQILNLPPEKMREAFEKINRNQDEELKASLPQDKYDALVEYQKNGGKKVKSKKRKKKKDKS